MHGWTEPASTLHLYAFAIALHNITDPMGADANAPMTKTASKYHSHGNLLCDLPFMNAIPNHRLRVNILARIFKSLTYSLCWTTPCFSAQSHSAANWIGADLCVA